MVFSAVTRSPISSRLVTVRVWLRSPIATASASPTARFSPRLMLSAIQVAAARPISSEAATMAVSSILAKSALSLAALAATFMRSVIWFETPS